MTTSTSIYYQSIETNSSDPTSSYSWKECMHTRTTAKRAVSSGTVRFREKLLRASKSIAKKAKPTRIKLDVKVREYKPLVSRDKDRMLRRRYIRRLILNGQRQMRRSIKQHVDITCVGELNAQITSDDISAFRDLGKNVRVASAKKHCQNFSLFTPILDTNLSLNTHFLSDTGFVAFIKNNLLIVFLHVPNSNASSSTGMQSFFTGLKNKINASSLIKKIPDIIMGDTNQSGISTVVNTLKTIYTGGNSFKLATSIVKDSTLKSPFGNLHGTNSTGEKFYDIALYNENTVHLPWIEYTNQFVYHGVNDDGDDGSDSDDDDATYEGRTDHQLSNIMSNGAVAVTDHKGILLHVKLK
ncbi:hypothetical protein [Marinomonas sp. PE14-40]|uniref:hypothetical protein n=1 Tax=Marinomonas sp. PE14-40 TaxID=3060621 RepID=UPI003F67A8BE